jgi:hypothetical protein
MEHWLHFVVVIIVQFLFFLFVSHNRKQKIGTTSFVRLLLLGVPFGFIFDVVVGEYFGVYDYYLGFGTMFLIINGLLSFGIMIATIELIKREEPLHFYLWTLALASTYEIANYFFPVWIWRFTENATLNESIVISVLYFGLSILAVIYLHISALIRKRITVH